MEFEWDRDKAARNREKHGVDFADASLVLYDEFGVTIEDDDADERRIVTLGLDPSGRLLVMVYTWRGEPVRIISARVATRAERRCYEGEP